MIKINKIEYCLKITAMIVISNFTGFKIITAQSKIFNKYGLTIINSTKFLQKEINDNPADQMIRNLLKSIMEKHGFKQLSKKWEELRIDSLFHFFNH